MNPYNKSATATATVTEPTIIVYGSPYQFSDKTANKLLVATFTHGGVGAGVDPASAFVATINWGDGSISTGTITQSTGIYFDIYYVTGSHTYASKGSYTITTTVVEAGSSRNIAAASFTTSGVTTPSTTSTSTGGSAAASGHAADAATARDAVLATTPSFGSIAFLSAKNDGAGAVPVADPDSLDSLFEALIDDGLDAGQNNGVG